MKDVLISAPYMLPFMQRFTPVLTRLGMRVIIPDVHERLSEEELLRYAGQFDGTICGDDRYTRRVIQACHPRLKVISKWGTGIDYEDEDESGGLMEAGGNARLRAAPGQRDEILPVPQDRPEAGDQFRPE